MHVLKRDVLTRISLVAADDSGRQRPTGGINILQGYVAQIDQRLCLARLQRICHASRTFAIWLLLLLRADVDTPPDRSMHVHIRIRNVDDLARACSALLRRVFVVAWISLDVDSLQWIFLLNFLEADVTHTAVVEVRRHGADGHADAKHGADVVDGEVLGTATHDHFVTAVGGLRYNCIVIVPDLDVLDEDVRAANVDPVRV